MALLAEYALTPDVLDLTSYSSEEVCTVHLQTVKDVLLEEGLVRNLRGGDWARIFAGDHRPWHRRAKEILKKLATQNRLTTYPAIAAAPPGTDSEWCAEALASHQKAALAGIIASKAVADGYKAEAIIAAIDRLSTTPWWTARSPSVRPDRTVADYRAKLELVLRYANSIMFIDPHVDPSRPQYKEFSTLVQAAGGRSPAPLIEVHRVCYHGSGRSRQLLDLGELEKVFRNELTAPMKAAGLDVDVFVWDDFHARYVISDIVGILMENGFDTTTAKVKTTWARLGRGDRDDVQREFTVASGRHALRRQFRIP
jgi:hypothetical protein